MNERETEQSTYDSVIDTNEQQHRESEEQNRESEQDSESNNAQSMDLDQMYSDYSSEHLEDLG